MDLSTYLQTVKMRVAALEAPRQLLHAKLGMVTEAGELCDLFKRQVAYGRDFDHVNLLEECGDWMWYSVLYCDLSEISMRTLDRWAVDTWKELQNPAKESQAADVNSLVLALSTSLLAAGEFIGGSQGELRDAAKGCFILVLWMLYKHGFTVEQCLVANDAKLEKRTGKAFDASRILNRDTDAERKVLEGHAKDR
jgi:NTP pyrophosphatase (non-canonical NTP hydrolase)